MLLAAGSPLVAGGAASMTHTQWIKVLRPFFHQKALLDVGAVVEVPAWLAAEVIYSTQAERAEQPVAVEAVKPEPEPKGTKHARK